MDKIIFALIFVCIGGIMKHENEKIKYERYQKQQKIKNKILQKIQATINQLLNDINNQTAASLNRFKINKSNVIYLSPGDHIAIDRYIPIPYTHHGIFVGNNQVIHYVYPGIVQKTDLSVFRYYSDGIIYKIQSYSPLSPEQIIQLAHSKIGTKNYDFVTNNCETFARWCRYGG